MTIKIYRIDADHHLHPIAPDPALEQSRQPDSMLWLDIEGPGTSEREEWLDRLEVQGLTRRLCLAASDRPGLYPLKQELFLVLPVLRETAEGPALHHVACLCREGLFVTMHEQPLVTDDRLADLDYAEAWLSERSVAALLAALFVDVSMDNVRLTGKLRSAIVRMEERMDQDPNSVEAGEIMALRADVLTLASAVGDLLPVAQPVSAIERRFFRLDTARDFMNCALVNLQAANGQLTWLDGRVSALRSGFEMHAQEQTNRRLGMLTILSAIFMPVTLLAGIWGMNFTTMPELGLPYAYPIALALMTAVGTGMYLFFRKTGWLD